MKKAINMIQKIVISEVIKIDLSLNSININEDCFIEGIKVEKSSIRESEDADSDNLNLNPGLYEMRKKVINEINIMIIMPRIHLKSALPKKMVAVFRKSVILKLL